MEKSKNSIEDLQIMEQASQNLTLQKQLFQIELSETISALESLKDAKGDVFKIVGNLMFKSDKSTLQKDLERKKQLLELRIKSIEKQEDEMNKKFSRVREEVLKDVK
ncbi:MAG: prefoldin subunit [Candidatus Pacearchaeota archaeon]|nr:prefoldin subunit [Candidatus Pacearchaeota archaeon]